MEEELKRYIQVWVSAIISVCYCYYLPSKIKPGVLRLLVQFFVFPMLFSSSIFITTTMFFLTGMRTSKLILFSFDKGPLFPLPSNLLQFICFTCFPIKKLQQNPRSQSSLYKWVFAIRVAIFGLLLHVGLGDYIQNLPLILLLGLHPLFMSVEVLLTLLKFLLTITLGCYLEPVFDEPYLATSLQDFWGRRWNLMVSSIFRSAIYAPTRDVFKRKPGLANFMGFFHDVPLLYSR